MKIADARRAVTRSQALRRLTCFAQERRHWGAFSNDSNESKFSKLLVGCLTAAVNAAVPPRSELAIEQACWTQRDPITPEQVLEGESS
jgi:hypothetical protein